MNRKFFFSFITLMPAVLLAFSVYAADDGTIARTSQIGGWTTALDCDFSALSTTPLDAGDGNYSLCGVTWVQFNNNANQADNQPDVTNGSGLKISPAQSQDWYGTTTTTPGFYVPLSTLVPNLNPMTPIRITARVDGNWSANYQGIHVGIYGIINSGGSLGWITVNKGYGDGVGVGIDYSTAQATSAGSIGVKTNQQVLVAVFPDGYGGSHAVGIADFLDGGNAFPPVTGYAAGAVNTLTAQSLTFPEGPSGPRVFVTVKRAGAASTFTAVIVRLKVEYQALQ